VTGPRPRGRDKRVDQSLGQGLVSELVGTAAQLLGALLGAVLTFLAYHKQFDAEDEPGAIFGAISTSPTVRSYAGTVVTEAFGAFMLVCVVPEFGETPAGLLCPLASSWAPVIGRQATAHALAPRRRRRVGPTIDPAPTGRGRCADTRPQRGSSFRSAVVRRCRNHLRESDHDDDCCHRCLR